MMKMRTTKMQQSFSKMTDFECILLLQRKIHSFSGVFLHYKTNLSIRLIRLLDGPKSAELHYKTRLIFKVLRYFGCCYLCTYHFLSCLYFPEYTWCWSNPFGQTGEQGTLPTVVFTKIYKLQISQFIWRSLLFFSQMLLQESTIIAS